MSNATEESAGTPAGAAGEKPGRRIVTGHLFRVPTKVGVRFSTEPPPPPPATVRRPSRVAQMLAFAHRIEAAIARGEYKDRADAARQLGVTRARLTQLMDLTLLAPDLQERVLFSEAIDGVEPMTERGLRTLVGRWLWSEQRERGSRVARPSWATSESMVRA